METEEKKAPARKTRKKAPAAKAEKPAEQAPEGASAQPAEQAPEEEAPQPAEQWRPALEEATVEVGDFQGINVREAKSLESEVIGSVANHETVEAYPEEDGWRELADGGFVVAKYLA